MGLSTKSWNEGPKLFNWEDPTDEIVKLVKRGRTAYATSDKLTSEY